MYKLIQFNLYDVQQNHVQKDNGDGSFTSFPAEENNPNYQQYLAWLEAGNTPLPADEPTQG